SFSVWEVVGGRRGRCYQGRCGPLFRRIHRVRIHFFARRIVKSEAISRILTARDVLKSNQKSPQLPTHTNCLPWRMRLMTLWRSVWLSCLASLVLIGPVAAENWPAWRGPRGDGTSRE